jgi:hypothetical protein
MADRNCINCKHTFRFPSDLKKHFTISFHCKKSEEEIKTYFSNINKITINKITKCIICNKEFSRKYSLERHLLNSECGTNKDIYNKSQSITKQELQLLIHQEAEKILQNRHNKNTINNNNTTNNTINNTINNNTTIIQHINPFGFEDVRAIPIPEMKTILNSGDKAGFQIIKSIYNKIENKNFYKPNMSRPEIACLNTDFNLTIYKSKEFCDALFDRCIAFLHHMLYLCKNEYSKNTIKNIYENIEYIETTIRTEIYDKQLQNIIESEFRNNNIDNKDRISKFIKETKENIETKEQSKSLLNNILTLTNESNNEYRISISDDEINRVFGDPKLLLGLNKKELIEEFTFKRYDETKFWKFWKDRIKNETTYINKCKTSTIGDMKTIKQRQMKIELMLNIIKARADNMKGGELINLDVEGFIIEEMVNDNMIDSDSDNDNEIDTNTENIT